MTRATFPPDVAGRNVSAFLDTIAYSELKPALLSISDDGYNVLVGSLPTRTINGVTYPPKLILAPNYDAHPHVLNAALDSTAAGRYQFIWATWQSAAKALGLRDFSPASQDAACVWLLKQCGAYAALTIGDFDTALRLASSQWASLPGSKAGQRTTPYTELFAVFSKAGGIATCLRPK